MMAFSSIIEPLRAANAISGQTLYRWVVVGLSSGEIEASNGVVVRAQCSVYDDPAADRIVVCTGGDADHVEAVESIGWIRRRLRDGAHLGAVADAAFVLARSGLLDGHACTLHWMSQAAFTEAFPHIELRRDIFVVDRKRFTSAGGVGSLDMMLDIIGTDYGPELAAGVAEWFVHSQLRSSVDRRLMPLRLRTGILDELVLSAIGIMEEELEEQLTIPVLAKRLGVSPDRLERAFRAHVSTSPGSYYRKMKLRRAEDLLAHSSLPIREIALSCGFSSMSSFTRAFKEATGQVPRSTRRPNAR
jgi:transcriptional regulator GlxA family with amidase domain